MDVIERLREVSSLMDLEPAEETGCPKLSLSQVKPAAKKEPFLSQAVLPNGKRITLLKSLQTTACERNCFYCPFRAGRNTRRVTFKPDEMASTYIDLHRAGIAQGIFLSSGIVGGGIRTQDKMLATAELLREKHSYQGYLHLKVMPGAERAQVERAMQLADRISINLEAPNTFRLGLLAPHKAFLDELLQPMRWVEEIRRSLPASGGWKGRWPSLTTQFVVGAVGESDQELLKTTAYLFDYIHLNRPYYSAFRPIENTPLDNLPAENPQRQNRLYQASFLLRDYGFQLEDLPFSTSGSLPLHVDPKLAWAQNNLAERPIEINRVTKQDLLRIPGVGPRGAQAIVDARRKGTLRELEDLRRLGINPTRAAPYILLNGKRPASQLSLW